jgi:hypothetical protein
MTGQTLAKVDSLKSLAASGFTVSEAASELSITYQYASQLARDHGLTSSRTQARAARLCRSVSTSTWGDPMGWYGVFMTWLILNEMFLLAMMGDI